MRSPVMLVPLILTLWGSDAGSAIDLVRDTRVGLMGVLAPEATDTGDSLGAMGKYRSPLLLGAVDSDGSPRTECPMPVVRPAPDASVPMPTNGRHPARDPVVFIDGQAANVSGMPVVRSGCWNPLDRPQGDADSARKGGAPRR